MKANALPFVMLLAGCSTTATTPAAPEVLMRFEQLTHDTSGQGIQTCRECPERTTKVVDMRPPVVAPVATRANPLADARPAISAASISIPDKSKAPAYIEPVTIHFAFGSFKLDEVARQEVRKLADLLKADPKRTVVVRGRTDPRGSAAFNQRLAVQRGQAVGAALLVEGINRSRFTLEPENPCCDGDRDASESVHRTLRRASVEIVISN